MDRKALGIYGGDSRILLLGEAPSRRMQEEGIEDALVIPRLVELTGRDADFFDSIFSRANVLRSWPGRSADGHGDAFPEKDARKAARRFLTFDVFSSFRLIVLLGRRVEDAMLRHLKHESVRKWFDYAPVDSRIFRRREDFVKASEDRKKDEDDPTRWKWTYVMVAPHPSGTSRWWNDSANVEKARTFWSKLSFVAEHDRWCPCRRTGRMIDGRRGACCPSPIPGRGLDDDSPRMPVVSRECVCLQEDRRYKGPLFNVRKDPS